MVFYLVGFVVDLTNAFAFVSIPVRILVRILILFVVLALTSRFLQLSFRGFSLHELN